MKYIRTKEGVYDLKLKPKYENDKKTIDFFVNNYYGGYNNFVKIADTIDELCDYWVIDDSKISGNKPRLFPCEELEFRDARKLVFAGSTRNTINLFGAIFTDKGLVYVAKADEKGNLQLL